jgi:hypothetical protein
MKHYKDEQDNIYAYESDGSQDAYIKDGLVPISDADLVILRTPTPAELQSQANATAQAYLASTDWMVLRQADSGEVMPNNIKDARAAARLEIK